MWLVLLSTYFNKIKLISKWKSISFQKEFSSCQISNFWQIQAKEKETEHIKTLNQEFGQRIQGIANDLNAILSKLKRKTNDIVQAKFEQKVRLNFP